MKKIEIGDTIKFSYLPELSTEEIIVTGKVIGFGEEVRKRWPTECADAPDEAMLLFRKDVFGNEQRHLVMPFEVLSVEADTSHPTKEA